MATSAFRRLRVWQASMSLAKDIYLLTRDFPGDELFGLVSQLKRAVVSVPSNIAEGHGRGAPREFGHFLSIASGSLAEIETQLELAKMLGFGSASRIDKLIARVEELSGQVGALRSTTRPSHQAPPRP